MARYRTLLRGMYDTQESLAITPDDNVRWAVYQQWLAAGNSPDPLPAPVPPTPTPAEIAATAELEAQAAMRATLKLDATITYLRTHTPAEVDAWVVAGVTDLASAKNLLRKLAQVVAYLARERIS